jgi:AcrR family transcriptional regulator
MSIDRRTKYTKRILQEALIELLKEKPITKITVTMLCKKADVNRSTFYSHYENQYDLLDKIAETVYADLKTYLNNNYLIDKSLFQKETMKILLRYVQQNSEVFKMLVSHNGRYNFFDLVYRLAREFSSEINIDSSDPQIEDLEEYILIFSISTSEAILKKWLNEGLKQSVDYMAELIMRLIYKGRNGIIKK